MSQAQKKQDETETPAEGIGTAISLLPDNLTPAAIYTEAGLDSLLAHVRKIAISEVRDVSTALGRKNIGSLAHKIARTKTSLDKMGESLLEEARKKVNGVNALRRKGWEALEALQHEIRAPLTEFEQAEETRMTGHEHALAEIEIAGIKATDHWLTTPIEDMQAIMNKLRGDNRDYEEFAARHAIVLKSALAALENAISKRLKHDADQAELERLRAAEADHARKEREEEIAHEAAAKAQCEAEAKALEEQKASEKREREAREEAQRAKDAEEKAKRDAEESESRRVRELAEAEERRKKEAADAERQAKEAEERRIKEAKEAEERAARIQKENEERAEQGRKDAESRIDRERIIAANAERERLEKEESDRKEAARKREENIKHRAKINNEALEAVANVLENNPPGGEFKGQAKAIIEAIARGEVPHTKISY